MTFFQNMQQNNNYGTFNNPTATAPLLDKTPRKNKEPQGDLARSKDRRMWADLIVKNFLAELKKNPKVLFDEIYKDVVIKLNMDGVRNLSKSNLDDLKRIASKETSRELQKIESSIVKTCVSNIEKCLANIMVDTKLHYKDVRLNQAEVLICLFHAGLMTKYQCRELTATIINNRIDHKIDLDDNIESFFNYTKEKNQKVIEEWSKIIDINLGKENDYVERERLFPDIKASLVKGLSKPFAKYEVQLPKDR